MVKAIGVRIPARYSTRLLVVLCMETFLHSDPGSLHVRFVPRVTKIGRLKALLVPF